MKNIFAVIGAGYGDEGKGLMTDYLCEQIRKTSNSLVVFRFNGGAQAGHTVHRGNLRHEFSHFGSGSLQDVPTYLGKYFVCNPIHFRREWEELENLGYTPEIYVNKQAFVTFPHDIMINQIVEKARGTDRHGSCGMGFNETIERCLSADPQLIDTRIAYLKDAIDDKVLISCIRNYTYKRLAKLLGKSMLDKKSLNLIEDDNIIVSFMNDVKFMLDRIQIVDNIPDVFENIVCEGAQGLQLSQYGGNFPHVTRSNTGLQNVCEELNVHENNFEVVYVTRCYQTKHGNGPFEYEVTNLENVNVVDPTNIPNEFQGSLRFAPLDMDKLFQAVFKDFTNNNILIKNVSFAVTCLDQIEHNVSFYRKGVEISLSEPNFVSAVHDSLKMFGFDHFYVSHGNCAKNITRLF